MAGSWTTTGFADLRVRGWIAVEQIPLAQTHGGRVLYSSGFRFVYVGTKVRWRKWWP